VEGYGEAEMDAMEYERRHGVTLSSMKTCVCDHDHNRVIKEIIVLKSICIPGQRLTIVLRGIADAGQLDLPTRFG
jgi:hypothetical protein